MSNEQSIYIEIGKRIREERKALGFNQSDLAKEIGLTRTSVVNIEVGRQRLPIHMLYRVAIALSIPINDLLPGEEKRIA